jgi:hypothetical protein
VAGLFQGLLIAAEAYSDYALQVAQSGPSWSLS